MQEKTKKLITIIMLVLALIGSAFAIYYAFIDQENVSMFWAAYWLTLALAFIAIILIAAFFFKSIFSSTKKLITFFVSLAVVIGVVIGLYFIAPGTSNVTLDTISAYEVTEPVAKFVETAIYLVYALVIASALSIVYVECSKAFKK